MPCMQQGSFDVVTVGLNKLCKTRIT